MFTRIALVFGALSSLSCAQASNDVSLEIYVEAGCPGCQQLIATDLNTTLTAEGVLDILGNIPVESRVQNS